jgi:8-oxo-dGTP pyrophosphatase MutT (NUDIX family)
MSVREGVFVVALKKSGNRPPQVLLQLRKNTGLHDGEFAFPGGKRENNETWLDAAHRELYEETGLVVGRDKLQKLCRCGGKDRDGTEWQCIFYFCVVDAVLEKPQVKEPNKHKKVEWHPIDRLPKNVASAVLKVISDLQEFFSPKSNRKKTRKILVPDLLSIMSDFKKNLVL